MLGIWMWPNELIKFGADSVFEDCRRIGVTDVFFLTKGLSGRCAFTTVLAPSMLEGRDLLAEAVSAAHARGIRLHAWFTSAQDENYCALHTDSALVHYSKGPSSKTVSIANTSYIHYLCTLINDMLQHEPVDGLHLDYLRYNHLLYGWSDADLMRYAQRGVDVAHSRNLIERTFFEKKENEQDIFEAFRSGDETALALAKARIEDVNQFADAVLDSVREGRNDLCRSAALMPEGAYDLAFAHLHYGQSYHELSQRFDLIVPMAYSVSYGMDADWVGKVMVDATAHKTKMLAGLHAFEGGSGLTLCKDIRAAQNIEGVDGICLFRYGTSLISVVREGMLELMNPTDTPVTRIAFYDGTQEESIEVSLATKQDIRIKLPFDAKILRAWSGEKEICAFMTESSSF